MIIPEFEVVVNEFTVIPHDTRIQEVRSDDIFDCEHQEWIIKSEHNFYLYILNITLVRVTLIKQQMVKVNLCNEPKKEMISIKIDYSYNIKYTFNIKGTHFFRTRCVF